MDTASVHTYPTKTIAENGTFGKRSTEWNFLKTLTSHYQYNSEYACVKHAQSGRCENVTCGREKKVAFSNEYGYVWTGPQALYCLLSFAARWRFCSS